ncbi:MAG: hydrogenase maturation protease [Gammaproteobacteria bacterium]|nr:MAG: hydrogenase maturation protease [Gammaproteobacteria bacterium]TND02129.1 MAG: hydrogenase maturation protease [Gammaproteobacteria bacterium]
MSPIIVIGVGSPFGIDRLGWDIVRLLQKHGVLKPLVPDTLTLESADRPGTRLVAMMKGAELAIIIDVVQSGMEAGTVVRLNQDDIHNAPHQVSVHGFGVADVIMLADKTGDLPPRLNIFGLEMGQDTDWTPTQIQKNKLVDVIVNEIQEFLAARANE